MIHFLELEAVYIAMYVFALVITLVVTSRDFMPKGAMKKGVLGITAAGVTLIGAHYLNTTSRMAGVEKQFEIGETVICENKMHRTVSRSVLVSKHTGWILEDHLFKNENYERDFHTSRCVDWIGEDFEEPSPKAPQN
ncbi:MAG: hypothetical protein WCR69_05510 [Sulfuricurvum sp.]|jgi:hypothetical protein